MKPTQRQPIDDSTSVPAEARVARRGICQPAFEQESQYFSLLVCFFGCYTEFQGSSISPFVLFVVVMS